MKNPAAVPVVGEGFAMWWECLGESQGCYDAYIEVGGRILLLLLRNLGRKHDVCHNVTYSSVVHTGLGVPIPKETQFHTVPFTQEAYAWVVVERHWHHGEAKWTWGTGSHRGEGGVVQSLWPCRGRWRCPIYQMKAEKQGYNLVMAKQYFLLVMSTNN